MELTYSSPLQPSTSKSTGCALKLLWLLCYMTLATVIIGRAWDAYWHITNVFDTFWSPPHVFVYVMSTIIGIVVAIITFIPNLRHNFGPAFGVPFISFQVPGSLFLLGSGFVALGIAGIVLDNIWHSAFGLNETPWSLPHAMIGQSLTLITYGFIACHFALRAYRPMRWGTILLFGYLLIGVSATMLGPLYQNNTRDTIRALASIPVLSLQPEAQHSFHIQLKWNLTRLNPALVIAGAAWAGVALALVNRLEQRSWQFLIIILVWTMLTLSSDHRSAEWLDQWHPVMHNAANWRPLPLLPAAIALVLARRLRLTQRWTWLWAGLVFGVLTMVGWGSEGWVLMLALLAAPAMLVGAQIGEQIFHVLEHPTKTRAWCLVLGLTVGLPVVTGIIDLYLRTQTP